MGSQNKGPFEYVSGSLQLYAEALNYHTGESSSVHLEVHKTKSDFSNSISKMPSTIQYEAKKFEKRTSSSYTNFRYEIYENGLHVLKATKPGDVPGSYAEYVKFIYKDGTIRAVYKDTIDNKGKNIHRHVKWPMKEV